MPDASAASNPFWWQISALAIPIALGLAGWLTQTLVQRAWNDFESRQALYLEVANAIESLFETNVSREGIRSYLRAIRRLWLIGSDDVIRSANRLSASIRNGNANTPGERERLYSHFVMTMRHDLRKRRYLPPKGTHLDIEDFPAESPGAGLQ